MQAPALRLWGVPELGSTLRFGPERRFQLLAVLGLQAGQWVERDQLAALLWPERSSSEARRNLRKVIFDAHALPGLQGLESGADALRWAVHSDLAAFHASRAQDPVAALAWRRGPPLQGLDDPRNAAFAEWLATERARLEQAWLATAAAGLQRLNDPAERATLARRMLALDALDEAAMTALLQAELAQGHSGAAQAEYRRYATLLAQELGVTPSRALAELMQPAAPPASTTEAGATPETFIGRRLELAELQQRLGQPTCRLLTLLGPGGMGKSSLARQVLRHCAGGFTAGQAWVALQDAHDASELPARLALALGLTLANQPDVLANLLQRWLAGREGRALLVLDNAEHLLAGPAGLAPQLQAALAAAPGLVLLLTSRARSGVAGEELFPLQGLAVPEADSRDLEAAASFDAVRLFERCASQARRSFVLAEHLPAVLTVCEAVGGLPLAIELAASWVRLLPPETIAQDIAAGASQALDLLERDPSAAGDPARHEHASLRAVLQGSWALLGAREQHALAALAVFQGGFTRAAAQAVAGCSLPMLSALADVSLLQVGEGGRFGLHPVVQGFAAERLAEDPAREAALRQQHGAHFAAWLAELEALARTAPARLVQAVAAEDANVRCAWRHAVAGVNHAHLLRMATPLRLYHEIGGRLVEGLAELQAALGLPGSGDDAQRLQARLHHAISSLMYRHGQLAQGLALSLSGVQAAERCGDRAALKGCLNNAGLMLWHQGRPEEALHQLNRALAEAETDGDRYGIAMALGNAAIAKKALGQFQEALADNQRSLAIGRELGNPQFVATRLNNIGNLHRALGEWQQARPVFAEAVRHCLAQGLPVPAQHAQLNAAMVELELGQTEAARAGLLALLEAQRQVPQHAVALNVEMGLARVAIAQGQPDEALPRLARVVQQARQLEFNTHPLQALVVFGEWLWARGRHDTAQALWHWAGHHPGLDEADRLAAQRLLQRHGLPELPEPGAWAPASEEEALALLRAEAG